jgi:hypothetical protein
LTDGSGRIEPRIDSGAVIPKEFVERLTAYKEIQVRWMERGVEV